MTKKKKKKKKLRKIKNRKKRRKVKTRKKSSKSKTKKILNNESIYRVSKRWSNNAHVDKNLYEKKYKLSIKNNDEFWKKEGKRINWIIKK